MSKAVVRLEKQKLTTIGSLQRHVERDSDKHSNRDIDITKSHLNMDMLNDDQLNKESRNIPIVNKIPKNKGYHDRVNYWLDSLNKWREHDGMKPQKFRKDAVRVVDFVVTSDQDFFANLSPEQTKDYFRDATRFFAKRYGHMVFAEVHMDETTPHMHIGLVPIVKTADKGYRLSAKLKFNRTELINLQTDFAKDMQAHGWQIERGQERSTAQHVDTPRFKHEQDEINQPLMLTMSQAKSLNYQDVPGKFLSNEQFEKLANQADRYRDYPKLQAENQRLSNKVNNQQTANKTLRRERNQLTAELLEQKEQNKALDKHIDWLEKELERLGKALELAKKTLLIVGRTLKGYLDPEKLKYAHNKINFELKDEYANSPVDKQIQMQIKESAGLKPENSPQPKRTEQRKKTISRGMHR